jgi:hypothetical protein
VQRKILGPKKGGNNRIPEKATLRGAGLFAPLTTYYLCACISRSLRWEGHVALCGRRAVRTEVWWGNSMIKRHLVDIGLDENIVLKWMLNKEDGKA